MKILIAAGGSGGHIFPAVALAQEISQKRSDSEICFVGSNKNLDRRIFEKEGFSFFTLSANKLPHRMGIRISIFLIKLLFDFVKSFFIMLSYRPDAVVGFGGYVSGPVVIAAYIFGIPKVVHEQNVVPGRANLFLFKLADRIAVSFEETCEFLGPHNGRSVFTGNPIRASMFTDAKEESIRVFGLDGDKFTILVIGGSQGARFLNEAFVDALYDLDENTKRSLQVIHITGIRDYGWVRASYGKLGLEHRIYSFIDRIEEAYSASDLVVTRSGASAIFEIAFFARPMILIPYPFANAHQIENARVFSKKGAAIEIDENDTAARTVKDKIMELVNSGEKLRELGRNAKSLSMPRSSEMLAEVVLNVAR